jgi:hypothetical protein
MVVGAFSLYGDVTQMTVGSVFSVFLGCVQLWFFNFSWFFCLFPLLLLLQFWFV